MKDDQLLSELLYLKLSFFREYHQSLAKEAVEKSWTHVDFLSRLAEGETLRRKDRATQRRIQADRFPVVKTLEQFDWTWPKKINRTHVQNLFRLSFLKDNANVIFIGGAGIGKSHLGTIDWDNGLITVYGKGCYVIALPEATERQLAKRFTRSAAGSAT